jgi:hypothetical protein
MADSGGKDMCAVIRKSAGDNPALLSVPGGARRKSDDQRNDDGRFVTCRILFQEHRRPTGAAQFLLGCRIPGQSATSASS